MGKVFRVYLDSAKVFSCRHCKTQLSCAEEIISKARPVVVTVCLYALSRHLFAHFVLLFLSPCVRQNFQGRSGKAYLFETA